MPLKDKKALAEYNKEYEKRPEVIARKKEYRKIYDKLPEVIERRRARERTPEHRAVRKKYAVEYRLRKEPGEKHRIRSATFDKFKNKILEENSVCEQCKDSKNLEIHHIEYVHTDMNKLKILCRQCHRALHLKLNKQGGKK